MTSSTIRTLYKRSLDIIARWPLDTGKESRDIGVYVRKYFIDLFPDGELTKIEPNRLETIRKEIDALERIVNNNHRNSLKCKYFTASGAKLDELRIMTSTAAQKQLEQLQSNKWASFKLQLSSMFKY